MWSRTFVSVVGADGEDGKSHVGVLVRVHLVGALSEGRLVVVDVADEHANVRRV